MENIWELQSLKKYLNEISGQYVEIKSINKMLKWE